MKAHVAVRIWEWTLAMGAVTLGVWALGSCHSKNQDCTGDGCPSQQTGPCKNAGDACAVATLEQGNFYCQKGKKPSEGICQSKCQPDPSDPEKEVCPVGSYCWSFDESLTMGACRQSTCTDMLAYATECAESSPQGGTCVPYVNQTFLCQPAGTQPEGGACADADQDPAPATEQLCAAGSICDGGLCRKICPTDRDDCLAPKQCLGASDLPGVGLCYEPCPPFSSGQCSEAGMGCNPITMDVGVCEPSGTGEVGKSCGTPTTRCQEGLLCLAESDHGAACRKLCNAQGQPGCAGAQDQCLELNQGSGVGICLQSCSPNASISGCPATEDCWMLEIGEGYCFLAGSQAKGQACLYPGESISCAPGLICLAESQGATEGACFERCTPFNDGTGKLCSGPTELCSPQTSLFGICATTLLSLSQEGVECAPSGEWCSENLICAQGQCLRVCRRTPPPSGTDCKVPGTTCSEVDPEWDVGLCLPPP